MAFIYVISSICLLLVGLWGYACRPLRDVEIILPNHRADFQPQLDKPPATCKDYAFWSSEWPGY